MNSFLFFYIYLYYNLEKNDTIKYMNLHDPIEFRFVKRRI